MVSFVSEKKSTIIQSIEYYLQILVCMYIYVECNFFKIPSRAGEVNTPTFPYNLEK